MKTIKTIFCIGIAVLLLTATQLLAATITDDAGQTLNFETPPARVASLVSAATEVMAAIGAADHLAGRMYHDAHMPGLADKPVFGGGFTPQWDLIAKAGPDLVIVAPRQLNQAKAELPNTPLLVWDDGASLAQADLKIGWLGDIFQKTAEAEAVRQGNRDFLDLIAQKTARIPEERRLRVIRVLQDESGLLTPGEDSFQTELIAAAGGIPPKMGPGSFVPLNLEAWKKFNPQVIYACGTGRAELMKFLEQPGWNEAEAVQNKNVQYFPCALTCRAATHTGYFAAWFSSLIYGDHFADRSQLVLPEGLLGEKPVPVDMPYVKKSAIVESRLFDFVHRTLLIDFKSPRLIVSSDGGQKTVSTVGNAFSPPPTWGLSHKLGFRQVQEDRLRVLKLNPQSVDILGTGADMNNLVVKSAAFKDQGNLIWQS